MTRRRVGAYRKKPPATECLHRGGLYLELQSLKRPLAHSTTFRHLCPTEVESAHRTQPQLVYAFVSVPPHQLRDRLSLSISVSSENR